MDLWMEGGGGDGWKGGGGIQGVWTPLALAKRGARGRGEFHWLLEFLPVVTSNIGHISEGLTGRLKKT